MLKFYKKNSISWFFFDMSIPDTIEYMQYCPTETAFRLSEFETKIFPECSWVWLDYFYKTEEVDYKKYYNLSKKYKVVVVSPELHGIKNKLNEDWIDKFYGICTDYV